MLERLAERHPDDANVHYALGQMRMRRRETATARGPRSAAPSSIHERVPLGPLPHGLAPARRGSGRGHRDGVAGRRRRRRSCSGTSSRARSTAAVAPPTPPSCAAACRRWPARSSSTPTSCATRACSSRSRELLELAAARQKTGEVRYHLVLAHARRRAPRRRDRRAPRRLPRDQGGFGSGTALLRPGRAGRARRRCCSSTAPAIAARVPARLDPLRRSLDSGRAGGRRCRRRRRRRRRARRCWSAPGRHAHALRALVRGQPRARRRHRRRRPRPACSGRAGQRGHHRSPGAVTHDRETARHRHPHPPASATGGPAEDGRWPAAGPRRPSCCARACTRRAAGSRSTRSSSGLER